MHLDNYMATETLASHSSDYTPHLLLDALLEHLSLPNDSALSRKLKVALPILADIRQGNRPIGGSMLMWMSEATGLSVADLRNLAGDRRLKSRLNVKRPS